MNNIPEKHVKSAIAYFISSHGFGHAARSSAILEELRLQRPDSRLEVFGATPSWFFEDSLSRPISHHQQAVDEGLSQVSSLEEDLGATASHLQATLPFPEARVAAMAERLLGLGTRAVVCDIAPFGLAVAQRAGLPSILVENFTWDWILNALVEREPRLAGPASLLRPLFASASLRIQTEPFCQKLPGTLITGPVSRKPRLGREAVRSALGIGPGETMVLVTMGGIAWDYGDLEALENARRGIAQRPWLVIPGAGEGCRIGRILALPHRSEFYHPDLIHASDGVLGKLGYSTVAEVYHANRPFAYVTRPGFPESPVLEAWVRRELPHLRVEAKAFRSGAWPLLASRLVNCPLPPAKPSPDTPAKRDGSAQISSRILDFLA